MTEYGEQSTAERVHGVRYSYQPSRQLKTAIEEFAGSHVRPGFLLRSSKEVYVRSVEYIRGAYREQDEAVQAAVEYARRRPIIIASAATRLLYRGSNDSTSPTGCRLIFLPAHQEVLRDLSASLDAYPSVLERDQTLRHYLFLDLPYDAVHLPYNEREEAALKAVIHEGLYKRLFSATVVGIRSREVSIAR